MKRNKIKREHPETSRSHLRNQEEHDLAYYIHDRVELMHQVFSVLKSKELKAMAPQCVGHISISDLQELCLEEVLGISSKRLCAILDGAEPPSDTESSLSASPERMETISLDSISSDEEILSQTSSKKEKKHKHKRRSSKSKGKSKKKSQKKQTEEEEGDAERSRASRAGLTVLELLELQARARAIRAQLQQEQATKQPSISETAAPSSHHSSDNEVEIKEEPAEVVEISSEDEKPNIQELQIESQPSTSIEAEKEKMELKSQQTVTKRINDLIITVPKAKPTRKIKLNRNKVTVSLSNEKIDDSVTNTENIITTETKEVTLKKVIDNPVKKHNPTSNDVEKNVNKSKDKSKKKLKKKEKKRNNIEKEGSDHDEITLQLSDTEKMDLLEDLDRKTYDNVSSSSSEDSESSSSDTGSDSTQGNVTTLKDNSFDKKCDNETTKVAEKISETHSEKENQETISDTKEEKGKIIDESKDKKNSGKELIEKDNNDGIQSMMIDEKSESEKLIELSVKQPVKTGYISTENDTNITEKGIEVTNIEDIPVKSDDLCENPRKEHKATKEDINTAVAEISSEKIESSASENEISHLNKHDNLEEVSKDVTKQSELITNQQEIEKELSEGEISDRASSEIEATEIQPEVVCISDEEKNSKSQKKKKKKEKKSKKEKKKSKSDFREGADQNFYRDNPENIELIDNRTVGEQSEQISLGDSDDVYEILELSDDSSCYEVEGISVLSKEPTAEEIEALSAKIDEIDREEVVTDEQIKEHERLESEKQNTENGQDNLENLENISWKDRYLGSKKVKKVLSTSNILNALRKKNKELKKKLEESKRKENEVEPEKLQEPMKNLEEGSIDHYNTLQGSSKYVDPVQEISLDDTQNIELENKGEEKTQVTKAMKRDAKQLLKMYKKLLKYNDINKQKDPNKKKKKKNKKLKEKDKNCIPANAATCENSNSALK